MVGAVVREGGYAKLGEERPFPLKVEIPLHREHRPKAPTCRFVIVGWAMKHQLGARAEGDLVSRSLDDPVGDDGDIDARADAKEVREADVAVYVESGASNHTRALILSVHQSRARPGDGEPHQHDQEGGEPAHDSTMHHYGKPVSAPRFYASRMSLIQVGEKSFDP